MQSYTSQQWLWYTRVAEMSIAVSGSFELRLMFGTHRNFAAPQTVESRVGKTRELATGHARLAHDRAARLAPHAAIQVVGTAALRLLVH